MLVDTHCHINFNTFDEDREEVIARARSAGIERLLNPGVDLDSSLAAIELADRYAEIYAAVGVHPTEARNWNGETLDRLRELAGHPKVVAIGEIGLDYYWEETPHDLQQTVLLEQLRLAAELNLPVVLHNREATEDILRILRRWQVEISSTNPLLARAPGVLHSFSASLQAAEEAIRMGFMIGITGPVTFRNAPELQDLVSKLPLDHLLVETDSPFLTPHPHRGERNEPAHVRSVVGKIAELKGLPYDLVAQATSDNAGRLLNW